MKTHPLAKAAAAATLQDVLDRLKGADDLSPSRCRDLRSAIVSFAKLRDHPAAAIPLDLADIRRTLDTMMPARAKISRKRWANMRSDLAAAIRASGLRPMLKTRGLRISPDWARLLEETDPSIRHGLSRFGRWASMHRIRPEEVDDSTIGRFLAELDAATLISNLHTRHGAVARAWNALVLPKGPADGLRPVRLPKTRAPKRIPWHDVPLSLRQEVERFCDWSSLPDPLAENARARALAPRTLILMRCHLHSAVSAAVAAGIPLAEISSLAKLVEPDVVRALLRQRWREDGSKLTTYTCGALASLVAVAKDWVKVSAETLAALKALRSKLGTLPSGMTDKNKALLRHFNDPRLTQDLIELPNKLWQASRRALANGRKYSFIDLQSALAIDLLLVKPLRMENLAPLDFKKHISWPQGRGKPALICIGGDGTKNGEESVFEIPTALAERFLIYRNEIAPAVIGVRPDAVFVTLASKQKTQAALQTAILRTVRRHLGIKMTPHQFRHFAAKLHLDVNPSALDLVGQLLDHKSLHSTRRFYAGLDSARASRAHAELIMKIRESRSPPARRAQKPRRPKD